MVIALMFACGTNLFAYWNSDKIVLKMYGARPITAAQDTYFYDCIRQLVRNANMPMPKLYVIQSDQPNAFATGRNPENAAVAVTTGLRHILTHEELMGVVAHELAHIKNRDTLIMTVTATLAGAIGMIANIAMFLPFFSSHNDEEGRGNPIAMIALAILAPMAAAIVQMAISRTREYDADKTGAEICGHPMWLARALSKIEQYVQGSRRPNHQAERNPATAHMFIINPLLGKGADNLFSTHPATHNRIEVLKKMKRPSEAHYDNFPDLKNIEKTGRDGSNPWH